jgi:hypothetical protein
MIDDDEDATQELPLTCPDVAPDGGAKSLKGTDGGTDIVTPGSQHSCKNNVVLYDAYRCGTCVSFTYDYDPEDRRVGFCSNPAKGGSRFRKAPVIYPKGDPLTREGEMACEHYKNLGKRAGG